MLFLNKIFSTSSKRLTTKDVQIKKNRLERLIDYYKDKIEFLSNPKIPPGLVAIACRDIPINQTCGSRRYDSKHIVKYINFYKKKLTQIRKDLKKII